MDELLGILRGIATAIATAVGGAVGGGANSVTATYGGNGIIVFTYNIAATNNGNFFFMFK